MEEVSRNFAGSLTHRCWGVLVVRQGHVRARRVRTCRACAAREPGGARACRRYVCAWSLMCRGPAVWSACGRVQGDVCEICVRRVRRFRRVCGQELRLVQLRSLHERSGQKLLAVHLRMHPRGCLAPVWLSPAARCRVLNSLSSAR